MVKYLNYEVYEQIYPFRTLIYYKKKLRFYGKKTMVLRKTLGYYWTDAVA